MVYPWILRTAKASDLALVSALLRGSDLPDDDIETHFDNFLLAFENRNLAGCVGLELYPQQSLFRSLAVVQTYRGKGLGALLTQSMLEHVREIGSSELFLLTTTAENFFEKFGFLKVNRKVAPDVIQQTTSFSQLCPASATLMRLNLEHL